MKKTTYLLVCLLVAVFAIACEDEISEPGDNPDYNSDSTGVTQNQTDTLIIDNLSGYVQKGPFINGSSITISELKSNLSPTGINYNTQIVDNKGTYGIKDVKFTSKFVELKANGFYFNEITGEKSTAQVTLYALSDLTDTTSLNVNILSNLERQRVEFLVSNGNAFREAKQKAQKEILSIFNFDPDTIKESELLDISKAGNDNAILLAISVILQGKRSEADLSELMANISTDIREDGKLTSETLGSELINQCKYLDLAEIRKNLVDRYNDLGADASIPDFEKYIKKFIDSTEFVYTSSIEYPEFSNYGENILFGEKDTFVALNEYSMAADLPVGTSLKIVLKGGLWGYYAMPDGPVNWDITKYSYSTRQQTFTSQEDGKACDLKILFDPPQQEDNLTIEYYENGSITPTKIKHLIIIDENSQSTNPPENDSIIYPEQTEAGRNILCPQNDTFYVDSTYSMAFNSELDDSIFITITGGSWEYSFYPMILAGWFVSEYNGSEKSQKFSFYEPMTEDSEIEFKFTGTGYSEPVIIEYKEYINGYLNTWSRSVRVFELKK